MTGGVMADENLLEGFRQNGSLPHDHAAYRAFACLLRPVRKLEAARHPAFFRADFIQFVCLLSLEKSYTAKTVRVERNQQFVSMGRTRGFGALGPLETPCYSSPLRCAWFAVGVCSGDSALRRARRKAFGRGTISVRRLAWLHCVLPTGEVPLDSLCLVKIVTMNPFQSTGAPQSSAHGDNRSSADLISTLQSDWSLEMDGTEMYQALASRERIPERRKIFEALSAIEQKHAERLAKHLLE